MKITRLLSFLLVFVLLVSGCSKNKGDEGEGDPSVEIASPSDVDFAENDSEMFTERDQDSNYDMNHCVSIQLNGDSATASSNSVKISGTTVQITEEATYLVSGTLNNGQLVVNTGDTAKLQIVLNGVSIASTTSAPLYILAADKVFVTLAAGTTNTLANGGSFIAIDQNNIDSAIFSKQDLTFNGSGALSVISPAGHGIVSKDDLVFAGGTYHITAQGHAVDGNDSIRMINSSITLESGKDGIHAENTDDATLGFVYISSGSCNIDAEGDGISAVAYLQINNGEIHITTSAKGIKAAGNLKISGGAFTIDSSDDALHSNAKAYILDGVFDIKSGDDGIHAQDTLEVSGGTIRITKSYEGLEALYVTVSGGDISIVASDDGINAAGGTDGSGVGGMDNGGRWGGMSSGNGSITISGGTIYIKAGGDQIDANGTLEISGGDITVCGGTQGDTSVLDYDKSAVISGGTFIGTGASMMAQTLTGNGQGVISFTINNQSSGTEVVVKNASGETVISVAPANSFQLVVLSSSNIVKGESYTVIVGTSNKTITAK